MHEIEIAYKCNWNCNYCCVETHTKKIISDQEIINNFLGLKLKDTTLTISGGEPSYASDYIFDTIIEYCKQFNIDLILNTNGRMFEKKSKYIKHFNKINYHCSENLEPIKIKKYNYPNIDYLLIVTDQNYYKLQSFIDINPGIYKIIPANNPYGVKAQELSIENYSEIFKRFYKYMTSESKLRFISKNKSFNDNDINYITNYKGNK